MGWSTLSDMANLTKIQRWWCDDGGYSKNMLAVTWTITPHRIPFRNYTAFVLCTFHQLAQKNIQACKTFDKGVGIVQGQISYNVDGLDQQIQERIRYQYLLYSSNMQIQKVLVISIHHCTKVGDVGRMNILLTDDQG